ncbi:uncharacterized protein UDID_18130 [Ustilago sp. UG-2017a]|nr:uncharacterized protein UDID_18130 [Ustilago sp. UG-2017a]
MTNPPYQTRSRASASAPPPPPRRLPIVVRLRPRDNSAPAAEPPASPVPARLVDPFASLAVPASPLEPLFLGMGDDTVVSRHSGSPPPALTVPARAGEDYSPVSPPRPDFYEVDAHGPPRELTTPERQALWEAELTRTPTPPPTANEVVDSILDAPRQGTPIYRLEVQPLTPPPRWRNRQTPPPPPPDHHLPTNGEIAGWAERFVVADLVARIADRHYPLAWDVPYGSIPERRLHRLAMLRLTEGCMPWPSWQCRRCFNLGIPCFASAFTNPFGERNRIPRACTHCYLAGLGHCERVIPAHPGMEYPGDGTPNLQPRGSHQAERAHLTVAGGDGPGLIRSEERTFDPVMSGGWVTAMRVVFHLRRPELASSILRALQLFVERHDQLYSERQPHESVTESGGPPDPIDLWVVPTVNERWTRAALAAPRVPSGYVDV